MPIYEYRCRACGAVSSHLARSFAAELHPACPRCRGEQMDRLISRPALIRSGGGGEGRQESDVAASLRRLRDDPDQPWSHEARDSLDAALHDLDSGSSDSGDLWGED